MARASAIGSGWLMVDVPDNVSRAKIASTGRGALRRIGK